MQKITPCLWFDTQAEEAVEFYTSLFENSKIGKTARYVEEGSKVSGMPVGTVMTVEFELEGQHFTALNGGPVFKFTPAISFSVRCETEKEIDMLWRKLSAGGAVLMELQAYPFSKKYGWLNDKYGVSWQLNLSDENRKQKIIPSLLFVGDKAGKAEEAMNFYASLFEDTSIITVARYEKGEGDTEGRVKYGLFTLNGQEFIAMDSGFAHAFAFTPAVSFVVNCKTQEEVDDFWDKFTEDGKEVQCGWLEDKYGVSWQIVPAVLGEMMQDKNPEKAKRVMKAMLQMKKLDLKKLQQAYEE